MSGPAWHRAPAKVNLGLRVVGRRPDGYHLLDSVFVPLALADRIRIEIEAAPATHVALAIRGHGPDVPADADNLVVRAARAFLAAAGRTARVAIELEKRIPSGAGLGGGSSDAAAVLRALDAHFANALARPALLRVAIGLGADVPFFLDPRPARVTGIGEAIEPLRDFPALDLLLVTPDPPLATAAVFRAWDAALTPSDAGHTMPRPRGGAAPSLHRTASTQSTPEPGPEPEHAARLERGPAGPDGVAWVAGVELGNDLEPVAARLHPGIARVRTELEGLGARAVAMSGSGPTVYGVFEGSERARAAARAGRWAATDRVAATRTCGDRTTDDEDGRR